MRGKYREISLEELVQETVDSICRAGAQNTGMYEKKEEL